MEYWEFILYLKGHREVLYTEQVNLMTLAYNTGMLSRESKHKPKSLEHYLDKIDKKFHGKEYRNAPVDRNKSMEIAKQIEKLREERQYGKQRS